MRAAAHYVLTARTTVDLGMQQAAQDAMINTLRHTGSSRREGYTGALVSMEPDGAVRAMVGGLDYEDNQFNRAAHARRQPGSSFKLYVYATGFENGMNPRSMVRDYGGNCGNWSPKNYCRRQLRPVADSHRRFPHVAEHPGRQRVAAVGREKVVEMTQRLGVVGVKKTCSMALGDTGITPLQHTGAFAHFANGGKTARPYGILEMFNSKGDLIYSRDRDEPPPAQVVSRKVVEDMNQMMLAVVTNGTAQKAALDFTTVVGKTGTSSSYRDAWFVGFTGALVTGVWVGYDDFRPMPGITGGSLPAQAWHSYMQVAHKNYRVIPPIPGLRPASQPGGRSAAAQRAQADRPGHGAGADGPGRRRSRAASCPTRRRVALKKLADTMRQAAGVQPTPARHARQRARGRRHATGRAWRAESAATRAEGEAADRRYRSGAPKCPPPASARGRDFVRQGPTGDAA